MRILQVHSDLQWGGVEQWLLQVARHIDRSAFTLDLFSASVAPHWADSIRALGLGLIQSPRPSHPWEYMRALARTLESRPRYDAIHCHFMDHGGLVLRQAAKAGIPVRIAHSHIDAGPVLHSIGGWRKAYFRTQNGVLRRHATLGLAASQEAASSMFGPAWQQDARWRILHCGIEVESFARPVDGAALRAQLGFKADDVVFGHVGRFTAQKNHSFLMIVARRLARLMPHARFLWIGDGPLRAEVIEAVESLGLTDRIVFLREHSDVPALMKGVMDAFLFPSLYEGLGLALIEAQTAGLPCFVSAVVPTEADIVPGLVTRISLCEEASDWAETIEATMRAPRRVSPNTALDLVRHSSFNIRQSTRMLEDLYLGQC